MTQPTNDTDVDADPDFDPTVPRGPHVPDRKSGVPLLAWLFVVLAIAELAWLVRRVDTSGTSPLDLVLLGLNMVPSVVAVLIPAALLWRHPDAMSRARTLFFGTVLFAAVEGLQVLAEPLQPIFEQLSPPSDDLQFLVPLAAAFGSLTSLIGSFGLFYIAVGLSQARRYEGQPRVATALVVSIVALLGIGSGLVSISRIPFGDTIITSTVVIYLAAQLILGVISVVAWAYLMVTASRGVGAGEDPPLGWLLATLGAALVLAAIGLASVQSLSLVTDATFVTAVGYLTLGGYSFGHVAMLVAFLVGLPSLEAFDDDELEDVDEIDDEAGVTETVASDRPDVPDVPEAPGL